jgi:hypothetical protein
MKVGTIDEGTWSRAIMIYMGCSAYGELCDGGKLVRAIDVGGDGGYGRLRIHDNEVVVCAPKGQSAPRH